jgi:hypothetical protein
MTAARQSRHRGTRGAALLEEVRVAVDPSELLAGSTIPAAHQHNAIYPSWQRPAC